MKTFPILFCLTLAWVAIGCSAIKPSHSGHAVSGESIVLAGNEPARLAFLPKPSSELKVRSTFREVAGTTTQFGAEDYSINWETGELQRTAKSRMPDFRTNNLYGVEDFDHSKFPGFGNSKFFVFVDYTTADPKAKLWPKQLPQTQLLPKSQKKLQSGSSLKIVAYGDSITAGGDATEPKLIYWEQWASALRQKYPDAAIEAINGATGGDSTRNGLQRLSEKVISQKPDLVIVAFGMNDHNVGGYGTPPDEFKVNLAKIIDRIRAETAAEIILLSTFPPNPKWHYGSHRMEVYAAATKEVAAEKQCAFGDIYSNWLAYLERKKPEDLLGNNINHPNDFGHWMYFAVMQNLGL